MKTVIFSHPWDGSFNKAILDQVVKKLDETKEKYTVIDLNKDGFNPVMTEKELSLYSQGKSIDPLVLKYQEILKNTDELILIFPVWWMSMPAILKGFFDKVMVKGFAYESAKNGIKGVPGEHHESNPKRFYPHRTDDRRGHHRYSGCHRPARLSGLHHPHSSL